MGNQISEQNKEVVDLHAGMISVCGLKFDGMVDGSFSFLMWQMEWVTGGYGDEGAVLLFHE